MKSEDQAEECRSLRDARPYSSLRCRIPYRLLGRRSMGAKRLVVSSKILMPAIPTENCDIVLTFSAKTDDSTLMWLLARFKSRAPAITVHVRHHSHTGIYGFYLTAPYENLLQGAEELGLLKPLKSEYGGGMKEFIYDDFDCFAGSDDEKTFFTSQERQSIVLHFLNELRATGDDSLSGIKFVEGQSIVPLLITKNIVWQVFPLHHNEDLRELRQSWVQAIFSSQPLDLVCRYFGVKICLYFAYLGHYTKWLLLPTLLGLLIFLFQGSSQVLSRYLETLSVSEPVQFAEDLCFVGFALFNVVWATFYLKFWKRTSTEYCYRWGTLEKKDEMLTDPRPLFTGDLMKSPITGHLELHYPAWKRKLFRYFVTVPVIAVCLLIVFVFMLLCFELQEWLNDLIKHEELPYVFSFTPKVLLAVVVTLCDEVYKKVATWLTHKENHRLEQTFETNLVIKMVLFQFVNSFLSLFYIGFYLRDMDRLRDQLAALLITRQVLGNLKEALMPYVVWKARLWGVGYRIATQMSESSLEKEVKRMTARTKSKNKLKKIEESGKDSDSEGILSEEDDDKLPTLTQAEVECQMKKYESTVDDFLEMSIQFGYVTLFSPAFPLAAFFALLNNLIEIRSDAFKLCLTFQRPFGQRVDSIGIWQDVLVVISFIAIIVNCALLGTSGVLHRMYPGLDTAVYILIIVIIEHLVFSMKFILSRMIPDLPPTVATEMARLEYKRTEALKQLVLQNGPHQPGQSQFSGSPDPRRKKVGESDQCSRMQQQKTSAALNSFPSHTVIAQSSAVSRSNDITLTACPDSPNSSLHLMRPQPPPRPSKQPASTNPFITTPTSQSSSLSSSVSSAPAEIADKVVAAAMHPLFDYSDICASSNTNSRSLPPIPAPLPAAVSVPPRSHTADFGNVETFRKLLRKRADLEVCRRRSEPVASAIKHALHAQRTGDDSNLQRKITNKEDLNNFESKQDSSALKDHIAKTREKLQYTLDDIKYAKKPETTDCTISQKDNESGMKLTAPSSSIPHKTPIGPSTSVSSGLHRFHSPRLLRGGVLAEPSSLTLKVLTRKSRSFSSADVTSAAVTEARHAFRNRMSWRGEVPVIRKEVSKDPISSGTQDVYRLQPKTPIELGHNIANSSPFNKTSPEGYLETSNSETKSTHTTENKSPISDVDEENIKRSQPEQTEVSTHNSMNRAVRESRNQPLSLSPKKKKTL